ncbi:MAG: adenosylcobalamin-dependent ribonucleoside-diphosphate reductase [Lysobacterales bacterium]|nr:MAG: adenosylcobalamin-dependent ribonucleoside-diphosphate reductase [Xanthomonadales bacterium]
MTNAVFTTPIAEHVWQARYRFVDANGNGDADIQATWQRVARAVASVEAAGQDRWHEAFAQLLDDFSFLPGGRILAGAGTGRRVTLANCFVMGAIGDAMDAVFEALREGALTMQAGGGVGYDFSTLRPHGAPARGTGNIASGPVAFMSLWDAMCAAVCATGARRGAMMAVLRCDHPDIRAFIGAKARPGALSHFNCSVGVTDAFMSAVAAGVDWELAFPVRGLERRVYERLPAGDLWDELMRSAYAHSEPGVLFLDRINRENNLWYCEELCATNPCGEVPLPPYGACNLGSFNLTAFVREPFTDRAGFAFDELAAAVPVATRFLDNVIDLSYYALPAQAECAHATRRLGLGFTGLADALILLGLGYDSDAGRRFAANVMRTIQEAAYAASVLLAREKGAFPRFDAKRFLAAPGPARLPARLRADIARHGLRNSHLTAVAPAGTISLLANSVSSGIEPVFLARHQRLLRNPQGRIEPFEVEDFACARWREGLGHRVGAISREAAPPALVSAQELPPEAHLGMQAAVQAHVDQAVSKTINLPDDIPYARFQHIYRQAYDLGLKGCTTFRPVSVPAAILSR